MCLADLAQHLGFSFPIVPREIVNRRTANRTVTGFGNITFHASEHRLNGFMVTPLIVRDEILPVPFLFIGNEFGELINFKFLIFRRMGIIESPLLKWDVSTDKVNKPAKLFMLVLNKLK